MIRCKYKYQLELLLEWSGKNFTLVPTVAVVTIKSRFLAAIYKMPALASISGGNWSGHHQCLRQLRRPFRQIINEASLASKMLLLMPARMTTPSVFWQPQYHHHHRQWFRHDRPNCSAILAHNLRAIDKNEIQVAKLSAPSAPIPSQSPISPPAKAVTSSITPIYSKMLLTSTAARILSPLDTSSLSSPAKTPSSSSMLMERAMTFRPSQWPSSKA